MPPSQFASARLLEGMVWLVSLVAAAAWAAAAAAAQSYQAAFAVRDLSPTQEQVRPFYKLTHQRAS